MKKLAKKAVKRLAPQLAEHIRRVRRIEDQLEKVSAKMDHELSTIQTQLASRDSRLDRLRALSKEVEPYQPAYGVANVIDSPRRTSHDRGIAIENALQPVAGKRILDIGSSLGYMSYYLADRGAVVEGWEFNAKNAEVSRLIGEINGLEVAFKTKEFTDKTVKDIRRGEFDAVMILSVFHHITHVHGLEYTQKLIKDLMDRIPVVIVELAKKGEDKNLFWDPTQPDDELDIFALVRKDVDIKKIGDFGNHLSSRTRPLYVISKKEVVHVAGHTYGYDNSSIEAYKGSPLAHRKDIRRKYFFADDYIVKEYGISAKINPDNLYQIMTEINTYVNVLQRHKIYHTPKLIDFEINENEAKLVVERIPGTLLSDVQEKLTASEITKIAKDILKTLSSLEEHKLHHNDVRSWNVIFNKQGAWLIDYGYTGPVSTDDDIVSLLWLLQAVERGERESYQQGKTSLPKPEDFKSSQLREMCSLVKKGERSATKLLAAFK